MALLRAMRVLAVVFHFACLSAAAALAASAAEPIGTKQCTKCHATLAKASLKHHEPKTLDNLSAPKAAQYAKATGGDPRNPKCLRCHAPLAMPTGPSAVSCETCHGPGKDYKVPHQEPAFYTQPDRKGLKDMFNKAGDVATLCVTCHVMGGEDKEIVAAGHPVGDKFDVAANLGKMVHWPSNDTDPPVSGGARKRSYDGAFYAAVASAGAGQVRSRAAAAGSARPAAAATGAAAPPAVGKPAAASEDGYQSLADDEFLSTPSLTAPRPAVAAPGARKPAPAPPPITTTALPDAVPEFEAPPPPPAPAAAGPPPAAKSVAEARGHAARVLQSMLQQKKKKVALPKPAPPAEIPGPDGELLSLQDEVLALGLDVLAQEQ